jgi:hypothetical protein
MSELINNSAKRKEILKHMILELHQGEAPAEVRSRLKELLKSIPYNEVVEVEQQLISEGLPEEEVLKFCDIHSAALEGSISSQEIEVPPAHPVDTLKKENREVEKVTTKIKSIFDSIPHISHETESKEVAGKVLQLKGLFNSLWDLDKHYKRKEYLLFPFLEKSGITAPPKVMWGKHDEIREQLKASLESLKLENISSKEELMSVIIMLLGPVVDAVESMIMKEEEILLPMCMEKFSEENWYQIYLETPVYGYCLYDTRDEWTPSPGVSEKVEANAESGEYSSSNKIYTNGSPIRLSSGSFDIKELESLFVSIPIDITYVDANDKVKFFSHSPKRVFERNRSIIGRDVRLCHPPGSVNIVEQILEDFKSGRENQAKFWLSNFMGRFVYIEYTALRGKDNEYLGVIEITQDITELRSLEGDQRLLSYSNKESK